MTVLGRRKPDVASTTLHMGQSHRGTSNLHARPLSRFDGIGLPKTAVEMVVFASNLGNLAGYDPDYDTIPNRQNTGLLNNCRWECADDKVAHGSLSR